MEASRLFRLSNFPFKERRVQLAKEKLLIVALLAAVGYGVMGGLLFAFSNVVMKALAYQTPASAIRTMQTINVYILNPLFFLVFLGTAVLSLILAVIALFHFSRPASSLVLAGSVLYLAGTVGVTFVFNVPLNNRLAALEPDTTEAAGYWLTYLAEWVRWNHVRTIACVAATVLTILAIRDFPLAAE